MYANLHFHSANSISVAACQTFVLERTFVVWKGHIVLTQSKRRQTQEMSFAVNLYYTL